MVELSREREGIWGLLYRRDALWLRIRRIWVVSGLDQERRAGLWTDHRSVRRWMRLGLWLCFPSVSGPALGHAIQGMARE